MNDFDKTVRDALGDRAAGAPTGRPDFAAVLAARQNRIRRATALGAAAIVAIGVIGMAVLAAGGSSESPGVADGPPPGDSGLATTLPAFPAPDDGTVWYCEGALERFDTFPATTTIVPPATTTIVPPATTTIVPPTTIAPSQPDDLPAPDAAEVPMETYVPPLEDSGYFRHCQQVSGDPLGEAVTESTTAEIVPDEVAGTVLPDVEVYPTTTSIAGN